MIHIGVGLSLEKEPTRAAKEAVERGQTNINKEKINLALVFSSIEFAHPSVLKTISNLLGQVPILGCSAAAIISNQGVFKRGLVIVLLGFGEDIYFTCAYTKDIKTKTAFSAGQELGEKLLSGLKGLPRALSVIFSDGLIKEGSNLIYGLQEKLGKSFPLAGASASDNFAYKRTYQYFNQEVFDNAACGAIFGGKLNFGLGVKHGWRPLGKPRYVTQSFGNIVYEIDNAPAADLYKEYLAWDLVKLRKELRRISILYPIGIYLAGEEEYLLRNILSIEDNGSLVLQGNIPEGSTIRLMIGTKESCLSATYEALSDAKKGLAGPMREFKKKPVNNFVLVFSSISRYMLLRRQAHKELEIIKKNLGQDTPIFGVYTYGEQAPLGTAGYRGQAYFHNQTVSVLMVEG